MQVVLSGDRDSILRMHHAAELQCSYQPTNSKIVCCMMMHATSACSCAADTDMCILDALTLPNNPPCTLLVLSEVACCYLLLYSANGQHIAWIWSLCSVSISIPQLARPFARPVKGKEVVSRPHPSI